MNLNIVPLVFIIAVKIQLSFGSVEKLPFRIQRI